MDLGVDKHFHQPLEVNAQEGRVPYHPQARDPDDQFQPEIGPVEESACSLEQIKEVDDQSQQKDPGEDLPANVREHE